MREVAGRCLPATGVKRGPHTHGGRGRAPRGRSQRRTGPLGSGAHCRASVEQLRGRALCSGGRPTAGPSPHTSLAMSLPRHSTHPPPGGATLLKQKPGHCTAAAPPAPPPCSPATPPRPAPPAPSVPDCRPAGYCRTPSRESKKMHRKNTILTQME